MHIEYAQEMLDYNKEQAKKWDWDCDPVVATVQSWVKEKEFIKFAKTVCSDKAKAILETIEGKADNKYFKVTSNMSYCVAIDILSKVSIEEILNAFKK